MPVLYVNLNKQGSLSKEPYATFLKKYEVIKDAPNGEEIELRVGGKEGTFTNGFYIDNFYYKNPRLRLNFATIPSPENDSEMSVFIRAVYSYEGEDCCDLDFHLQRVKDIKKRAPYYYLHGVSHFEFSSQIDDEYRLVFDAIADDNTRVEKVCCQLISLIISIFSLDN